MLKVSLKCVLGPMALEWCYRVHYYFEMLSRISGTGKYECPICGYTGKFQTYGHPPRYNAKCPICDSLERHRLFCLALKRGGLISGSETVLHFAPEHCLTKIIQQAAAKYRTADIRPGCASMVLNIEKIDLPDNSVDVVIANHVLEHVNDRAALKEIHRILKEDGRLIASVPIVEGWAETYEDPSITDDVGRNLHFGQFDHVRFYGRDFRERLKSAGFSPEEFVCGGTDTVNFSLYRGDPIFICAKLQPARSLRGTFHNA